MIAFLLLLAASARAEFDVREWRFVRAVQAPANPANSKYATLELDAAAFGSAEISLADLRLVDGGNDEVPYRVNAESSHNSSARLSATMLNLGHSGATTSFVLDLAAGSRYHPVFQHNSVTIETKPRDFMAQVKVESSSDGSFWQVIREKAVIFGVAGDYKASHLAVSYPQSTMRYLRLSVTPQKGEGLEVHGASVFREVAPARVQSPWTPRRAARREDGKTSVWDIDMGFDNVPVSRVLVLTGEADFRRPISIAALETGPGGVEREVGSMHGALWRFAAPGISDENLSLEGGDLRRRLYRVKIDNGDNPPLKVESLGFFGPKTSLYFPSGRPAPYRLYSGNSQARAPVYDLASFPGYLNFSMGPAAGFLDALPKPNPQYEYVDRRPWTEKHEKTFWASLALLCVFLLLTIGQKTREILKA